MKNPGRYSAGRDREFHVLLLSPGFPADEADDSCIPPLQLVLRGLRESFPAIRISVLALNYPFSRQAYDWNGIEVMPLGGRNRVLPLRVPAFQRGLKLARRLHRRRPIHLVHALWLSDAALLGQLVVRRLGVPMAATVMGQDARTSNRYLRWLSLDSMRLSAVSRRAADTFEASSGRRIDHILPWGIIVKGDELQSWDERSIDILGVGSLTENKDFATFVRVVDRLRKDGREIRAAIIGDGPQREALERDLRKRGLSGCVDFYGKQPRTRVLQLMRRSRILLHPSRYESFGFVFLEARANGLKIVSRPVGIAAAGPRWDVCKEEDTMVLSCAAMLDRAGPTLPLAEFRLDEAVEGWAALYGLDRPSSP